MMMAEIFLQKLLSYQGSGSSADDSFELLDPTSDSSSSQLSLEQVSLFTSLTASMF